MTSGSIRVAMTSDVGLRRRNNQDTGFVDRGIYAVCDGMGGGMGGEQASRLAAEHLGKLARLSVRDRHDIETMLAEAQRDILALGDRLGGTAGTTITGLVLPSVTAGNDGNDDSDEHGSPADGLPRHAYVVNVGDSRTYHMDPLPTAVHAGNADAADFADQDDGSTDGITEEATEEATVAASPRWDASSLTRITRDHSRRQETIDSGEMLPEVAVATIPRNIITQCLGDPDGIEPDVYVADLTGRFIVCSDGLHGEVPDARIAAIAAAYDEPQDAVDALVRAALDAGGTDNITVIVADMPVAEPHFHGFGAVRLADGEDIGTIEDNTLQTLRTIRSA